MTACAFVWYLAVAQQTTQAPNLPRPYATSSADNAPRITTPPKGFLPHVPAGFRVSMYAAGFAEPRWLATAPNGDTFVSDNRANAVYLLHPPRKAGDSPGRETFADNLRQPFGIAFWKNYCYIANTDEVVRFQYDPKTSKRLGKAEHILDLPGGGYHQHWTRTIAFSPDGTKLYTAVGSQTNVAVEPDQRRAAIIISDVDGKNARIFASGLRNAVGLGFNPQSRELWATVNERDELGDDLPPDYFTHVQDGGFYGWPYSYIGKHVDDRIKPQRPDLVAKAIVPDVLLGAHVAALEFVFYEATNFPAQYQHGAFIAEHGSWNRHRRDGYQIVFVPFSNGRPSGPPTPFLTGFVPDSTGSSVYGRPVGVTLMQDGTMLISDDGARIIWRIEAAR